MTSAAGDRHDPSVGQSQARGMASSITPLDPAAVSDAMLADIYALRYACHVEAVPEDPQQGVVEWMSMIRLPPAHIRRWHWVIDGGYACLTMIGHGLTANVDILVAREYRRHGIGAALLNVVRDQAITTGCHSIIGRYADATGAGFAAAVGAYAGNRQVRSVLSLDALVAAPIAVSGYTLMSWERAPENLLASYASARNAINDAPHTQGQADDAWTPDMVRDIEAVVAARGRQTRVTVALDASGEVVAFTELRLSPDAGAVAATEDTAVIATHRGRGLARWIKTASLHQLRIERPDVQVVATSNDATNTGMLQVNRRLGFRPAAIWTEAVLHVHANGSKPR